MRFLVVYLLSGLTGSVFSFVGNRSLSAGASGAIFGLIGAIIVYFATHRERFGAWGRRRLSGLLLTAGFNLVWGMSNPGIDNLGHIGGLLAGLVLGWAHCPAYRLEYAGDGGAFRAVAGFRRARAIGVSIGLSSALVFLTVLGVRLQA